MTMSANNLLVRRCPNGAWTVCGRRFSAKWLAVRWALRFAGSFMRATVGVDISDGGDRSIVTLALFRLEVEVVEGEYLGQTTTAFDDMFKGAVATPWPAG